MAENIMAQARLWRAKTIIRNVYIILSIECDATRPPRFAPRRVREFLNCQGVYRELKSLRLKRTESGDPAKPLSKRGALMHAQTSLPAPSLSSSSNALASLRSARSKPCTRGSQISQALAHLRNALLRLPLCGQRPP